MQIFAVLFLFGMVAAHHITKWDTQTFDRQPLEHESATTFTHNSAPNTPANISHSTQIGRNGRLVTTMKTFTKITSEYLSNVPLEEEEDELPPKTATIPPVQYE